MALGYSIMTVTTGSMENAGFGVGDKIFIKKKTPSNYQIGDYIAFFDYADPDCSYFTDATQTKMPKKPPKNTRMVFHEIIDIFEDSNKNLWFRTKGTNNNHTDVNLIYQDYVIGEYVFVPNWITNIIKSFSTIRGVSCYIVAPCLIILFKDCMTLVGLVFDYLDEKHKEKKKIIN